MGMLIGYGDRLRAGKNRLHLAPSFADPAQDFMFCIDGFRRRKLPGGRIAAALDQLEFAGRESLIQVSEHLGYVTSPMPRRRPSRIRARSSTTASRSKFLSRENVSDSRTRSIV